MSKLNKSDSATYKKSPFIYKLLSMIIICLIVFCSLLLGLYIMGNFQIFQDRSQTIILKVLSYTGIFTALLSIPLLIENIIMLITEKEKIKYVIRILWVCLAIIFCILCVGLSDIIIYLSEGF
ncbi:MAG: hypothetical protein K5866_01330 [Treponema sp.]|nr:hypothetical protein [Treponema sp.]